MTRARLRAAVLTLALVAAGAAFAAAVTVLTSSIASPEIGLREDPNLGVLAPAPRTTATTTARTRPTTTARGRTTPRHRTTPAPTAQPAPTSRPAPAGSDDDHGSDDGTSGRGRNRGRGGGDDD